ncbi:MAG: PqqD family protein [Gemmatimonadota bacterium]
MPHLAPPGRVDDRPRAHSWTPRAVPGLHTQAIDDEVLVLDRAHERLHRLNEVAAEILLRCDGTATTDEIARAIAADFDAPAAQVTGDVERTIVRMRALELVE